jgi:hypothetical protein
MSSSVAQEIEAIVQVEQSFDVNSVTYQGICIWPIVRLQLCFLHGVYRNNPEAFPKHKPLITRVKNVQRLKFSQISEEYINQSQTWHSILAPLRLVRQTDILFFSRFENHSETLNGKFVDRCLDPIWDTCAPHVKKLKLELDCPQSRQKQPRSEPSLLINPAPCLNKELLLKQCLTGSVDFPKIKNFQALQDIIWEKTGFIWLEESQLLNQLYLLDAYCIFFRDLLTVLRPRAVFLVCYYYIAAMALIKSCRDLKIETVEVQHGIQGKYHSLYAHWTRIPLAGYELLPNRFWVWSEQCKQDMLTTRPEVSGNHSQHLPIVGGNGWLAQWQEKDLGVTERHQQFINQLGKYQKVILVACSHLPDMPELLQVLTPAMSSASRSWFWLLRLHPLHKGNRELQFIHSTLGQLQNAAFDIHFATEIPLYALLKRCDYHVTQGSTVCHEATAFGVRTGIVDRSRSNGFVYYRDQISSGQFDYINQAEDLLGLIEKSARLSPESMDGNGYINAKPSTIRQALETILGRSGATIRQ